MLKSCINSGINFDRVIIISAQDYPIVPNKKITQDFSSFPQKQYIKAQRLESSQIKKQQDKVRVYHFCRDIRVPHNIKRFVVWLLRVVMTALPIRKKLYFTNGNKKYDIYQGSSYMALTFDCAKYVYSQMSSNTKLMRYLRWSYIPEELVIPTIVFNSEYGHNAEMASGDRLVERSAITYFDYGKSFHCRIILN